MTESTSAYLLLLRCLSDDEVSRWRHELDEALSRRRWRVPFVMLQWGKVVEERTVPTRTKRASGTIEAG